MKILSTVLKSILLLFCVVGGYLWYSFQLFDEPQVYFEGGHLSTYQLSQNTHKNVQCWQRQAVLPIEQNTFNLLVWNIHKGLDQGWQTTLQEYSDQADFVLLQEATDQQHIQHIVGNTLPQQILASGFAYLNRNSGVMTLSHFQPESVCVGMEKEPWIRTPKIGLATTYPLSNGEQLLVVNLHLVNFEWTPTKYQEQLTQAIEIISRHQGPMIIAGDFNTWNQGRIHLLSRLMEQYQLQEVVFRPDVRLRFLNYPLDHIFVRGLKVRHATTKPTDSSDHAPLLVTLELTSL